MATLADLLQRDMLEMTGSAGLAARAANYVLSGTDADVLAVIGPAPAPPAASSAKRAGLSTETRYEMLSGLVGLANPSVLVRFARVTLAARGSGLFTFWAPTWPEVLWLDALLRSVDIYVRQGERLMTCEHIVGMLESEGLSAEVLVRGAWTAKHGRSIDVLAQVPGYGGLLAREASLIREWFQKAGAAERIGFLQLMLKAQCDAEPFLCELVEFATGPAKTVREAAEPLLARARDLARPELERLARDGASARRAHAFRLLAAFWGEEARPFLCQFETEKLSLAAREAQEKALAASTPTEPAPPAAPAEAIETNVPLSEPARQAFRQMMHAQSGLLVQMNHVVAPLSAEAIEQQLHLVETLAVPRCEGQPLAQVNLGHPAVRDPFIQFLDTADIELIHAVRLLLLNYSLHTHANPHFMPVAGLLLERFRRRRPFDLRQLGRVFDAVGIGQRLIIEFMVQEAGVCQNWDSALVGPFLLDHVPGLEQLLKERPSTAYGAPAGPFYRMLGHLPVIPDALVEGLWRLATGTTAERDQARQLLEKLPDLEMRLERTLRGGKAGTRAKVAQWIAQRGGASAIPALRKALDGEKEESVRQALMSALERLGAPLEMAVSREGLLFESATLLNKGIPTAVAWFPFDAMPEVRWADSGKPVEAVILKRLIINNHKLASSEPSPMLRRISAEFCAEDRNALGQFVVDTWLERDLREKPPEPEPLTPTQIAHMEAMAQKWFAQNLPFAKLLIPPGAMSAETFCNPTSTATKDRGILAITSACAGENAVPKIAAYLKEWYGYRPAQCKALLGVLPWLEAPGATQLLLATARRFRTRTIQEEAERLSREMAQRRRWTMDQLGDRTIPDAGFAHNGTLQLPLGKRTLILRLTPQLTTELVTAEGKLLKSFPNASAQDDETLYKAAKADFTGARSTVKIVAAQQAQRLYEALCTEREWTFSELREYLFEHSIAGLLCRRLVWQSASRTFRPLGDGTLTDVCDMQVELDGAAQVRLAYCPADAEAWRRHLADYEVTPLFSQLDRPLHVPADLTAGELADFRGYAVGFFRLNNLVTKFGYRHAPVIDGPGFQSFLKRISGLNLDLELTFSGMQMPPVDETVFLMELRFARDGAPLSLAEVPRVLLSECWYDLKTIADAGTGYDPEWESKMP